MKKKQLACQQASPRRQKRSLRVSRWHPDTG